MASTARPVRYSARSRRSRLRRGELLIVIRHMVSRSGVVAEGETTRVRLDCVDSGVLADVDPTDSRQLLHGFLSRLESCRHLCPLRRLCQVFGRYHV